MQPSRRVLLVEDNSQNRYLASVLLKQEGYDVVPVATGDAALAALASGPFAFALLDLQLPDTDGVELAARIHGSRGCEELPLIAVSAFATFTHRRRAFAAGFTGYLEKPIDADAFVAQVRCLAGADVP